jgi:glycosyltransferase involved in cell wall biosynthesis
MTAPKGDHKWPVVFLIDELLGPGGTEVHLKFIAARFKELGHPVEIWTLNATEWIDAFKETGVRVRVFDLPGVFRPYVGRSLDRLTLALDEFAPDGQVILQAYHTASDFLAALMRRRHPRIRSISSWRDMGIYRTPAHILAQRLVSKHIDKLLVVSEAVRVAASARTGVPAVHIGVIHNGVDTARFRPPRNGERTAMREALGLRPGDVAALTVGSFSSFKGQDLILQSAAALKREGLSFRPVFAGSGETFEHNQQLAQRLGVDNALFLGVRTDIPELLWAADLFVLTSWSEGFSNAVIEGMAAGLPVVATAVGGNAQAVTRECGTLLPAGDLERLNAALRPLVASQKLRASSGQAARKRAETVFPLDTMVEAYRDVHRELLRA